MSAEPEPATSTEDAADAQPGCDLPWCGATPAGHLGSRPMIPVEALTAHPHNIRADLDLDPAFTASVKDSGILVPLRITIIPDEHGDAIGYRVIDGHRRLAAAVAAGLSEVPFDLATERAGDEAGQYLDMFTAHRHRKGYNRLEEADALFAAREAGANRTRIRKQTGLKPEEVKAALAAATLDTEARAGVGEVIEERGDELTLDELAIVAEFQDDPDALSRLLSLAAYHDSLEHQAERLRQEREVRAAHARLVTELTASGLAITDEQPLGSLLLALLRHDGERLIPDARLVPWPRAFQAAVLAEAQERVVAAQRRLVIQGNQAWRAAAKVRHRWLHELFARRTAPREVEAFLAGQLLTWPEVVSRFLGSAGSSSLWQWSRT